MSQNALTKDVLEGRFTAIQTDSRKVIPGSLFVALAGDTFDGHQFIEETLKKGCTGILCRKGSVHAKVKAEYPHARFFEVNDTLPAYRELAKAWRAQFNVPVVAVAGSVGKTTTKEMLAAILSGKFENVFKTTGSQNGFIGIPLTLLEIKKEHDVVVVEVGIDEIGTMQGHLDVVMPTAGMLTAIGPEHLERLKDIETVAREEGIVMEWLANNGCIAIVNLDDPYISPHAAKFSKNALGFALNDAISTSILYLRARIHENRLLVTGCDWKEEAFTLPLPGEHNARNFLGAITMAKALGMSANEIREGISHFRAAFGRTDVREIGQAKYICDYYNANPTSMEAALGLFNSMKTGKKFVCLGDMLELGEKEEFYHRALADMILAHKVSAAFLFGNRMKWLEDELKKKGFKEVVHFNSHAELAQALQQTQKAGDAVLIKGSRGMKMEEVFKIISGEKSEKTK